MEPSAKIIADSISPDGVRLTTMEVRLHRFVLAEFNTHRVFSRNSASSRAIPVTKMLQRVETDPAFPLVWPAEQKGMQGGADLVDDGPDQALSQAKSNWAYAARQAVQAAKVLTGNGLHKSVTNRLLEPFLDHTVVVTSTAWENFFALRLDLDAQPEIRAAAVAMRRAFDASTPKTLRQDEWHLPYIQSEDWAAATDHVEMGKSMYPLMARVSAARCARVSYLTQDGQRSLTADLTLYDRLVTDRLDKGLAIHWSPLEHVATPWADNRQKHDPYFNFVDFDGCKRGVATQHLPRVGNLLGWRSLRTTVETIQKERTYR